MANSTTSLDRPLMAIILLAYRQEKYIREAIQSVLAQTYSPLEIIVSDDASPDGTWGILDEEIKKYTGSHSIILHRNQKNLGLMGNLLKAVSLSTAPYLVMAAGDDISEPDRVAIIARAFVRGERNVTLVASNAAYIDETGRPLPSASWPEHTCSDPESIFDNIVVAGGAWAAYRRDLFDVFLPIDLRISNEDVVLTHRAALMGDLIFLAEKLVRYRRHGENVSKPENIPLVPRGLIDWYRHHSEYGVILRRQIRTDVVWAIERNKIDPKVGAKLLSILDRHDTNADAISAMFVARGVLYRLSLILKLRQYQPKLRFRFLLMALDIRLYVALVRFKRWLGK